MSDYNNPRLFEIAKQIALEHGYDYHHPITREVTKAPRPKTNKQAKRKKKKQ